jgi:pentatricopeptide repeat protein
MLARHFSLTRASHAAAYASRRVHHAAPPPDHSRSTATGVLPGGRAADMEHLGWMFGSGLWPGALELAAAVKTAAALPDGGDFVKCLHGLAVKAGRAGSASVGKAVMDAYGRSGKLADARQAFDEMASPDAVCWNILITAFSRSGRLDESFSMFRSMLSCGMSESMPTAVTVAVVVPVCAKLRHLWAGKSVHSYAIKTGLELDTLWKCTGINVRKMWREQSTG